MVFIVGGGVRFVIILGVFSGMLSRSGAGGGGGVVIATVSGLQGIISLILRLRGLISGS